MNKQSTINKDICTGCGKCIQVCPSVVISIKDKRANFTDKHQALCVQCAQCMAVCPEEAIFINGFTYEKDLKELPEKEKKPEYFTQLEVNWL